MTKETVEHLFKSLQKEMADEWKTRTINDFDFSKKQEAWEMQLRTLQSIHELYEFEIERTQKEEGCTNTLSNEQQEQMEVSVTTEDATVNTEDTIEIQEDREGEFETFEFQRNLKGGILQNIGGYVPESIVRNLGLEHGDMVSAEKSSYQPAFVGNVRYDYKLVAKRHLQDNRGRAQYNLCPVEETGGILIVRKSQESGLIKAKGEMMQLIISSSDKIEFSLAAGDLVDIAFFDEDPTHCRVIWKHRISELPEENRPTAVKPKKKTAAKPNIENSGELEGKTVLVIGESHHSHLYEAEVKKHGGTLLMADGKQKSQTIRSKVAQADIVMCVVVMCSHAGMECSKDEAKKEGVPFVPVSTKSANTVVRLAIEEFNKMTA